MSFSYDSSLASDLDKVRLYIGDTVSPGLFSNEEIAAYLLIETNVLLCAAALADGLAARFSKSVSFSLEGLSISNSIKADNYRNLADRLRAQAASGGGGAGGAAIVGGPFVSGISLGAMDSVEQNTDRNPSRIKIGQDDNPSGAAPEILVP